MRKTKKMLAVESQHGPLEDVLVDLYNNQDLTERQIGLRLGVPIATLAYWKLALGLRLERVLLRPGETLEVRRNGKAAQ